LFPGVPFILVEGRKQLTGWDGIGDESEPFWVLRGTALRDELNLYFFRVGDDPTSFQEIFERVLALS